MNDLIDRQAAIDALCKACMLTSDYKKCEGYKPDSRWCEEITALREVPSAQPDVQPVRHGHWNWFDGVHCSVCNYKLQSTGIPSCCPNCGAKMEQGAP